MIETQADPTLRPRSFAEFIGQREAVANLRIAVDAARRGGRALDHILLAGPSGVGKSSLAHLIARELGSRCHVTSGPAIAHKGELASLLTMVEEHDVLFVDEIHGLRSSIQEYFYPAIEDFRLDMFGRRGNTRPITIQLPRFTLVGATTRPSLLTTPLRDRFGISLNLRHYEVGDMTAIVQRSAQRLGVDIDEGGAAEIGRRSRGTPRVANRLLRRVRDHAESCRAAVIDRMLAATALDQQGLDPIGLDTLDRAYLRTLCDTFGGGPIGIEAIATTLGEERETLEDLVEPMLLSLGYVTRTARGRIATPAGIEHLRRHVEISATTAAA